MVFPQVLDLAADVLRRIPEEIDYEQTAKIMADDPSPLNVVLLQEVTAPHTTLQCWSTDSNKSRTACRVFPTLIDNGNGFTIRSKLEV